jgi:hypothetical protein
MLARKHGGTGSQLCLDKHMRPRIAVYGRLFPELSKRHCRLAATLHEGACYFRLADLRSEIVGRTSGEMRSPFRSPLEVTARRLGFLVGRRRLSLGLDFKPGCRRLSRGRLGRRVQPTKRPPGSWVRSLSNSEVLLLVMGFCDAQSSDFVLQGRALQAQSFSGSALASDPS